MQSLGVLRDNLRMRTTPHTSSALPRSMNGAQPSKPETVRSAWARTLTRTLGAALLVGSLGSAWAQSSPAGEWQTVDDHSGKAVSHVVVKEVGKAFQGSITRIIDPNKVNLKCEACEGPLRDAPFIGLTIIQGVSATPAEPLTWEGGHILDPKSGRNYRVRLRLKDEGQTMEVRGYIGSPYFGRTQTWRRVPAS